MLIKDIEAVAKALEEQDVPMEERWMWVTEDHVEAMKKELEEAILGAEDGN